MEQRNQFGRGALGLLVAVLAIGLLLSGLQRVALGAVAYMSSANNLRQITYGCHSFAEVHDGKFPPSVGTILSRDGTLFYHLLPFVEQEGGSKANRLDAVVKVYTSPRDPTAQQPGNWTSYASNTTAFGRAPRRFAGPAIPTTPVRRRATGRPVSGCRRARGAWRQS